MWESSGTLLGSECLNNTACPAQSQSLVEELKKFKEKVSSTGIYVETQSYLDNTVGSTESKSTRKN